MIQTNQLNPTFAGTAVPKSTTGLTGAAPLASANSEMGYGDFSSILNETMLRSLSTGALDNASSGETVFALDPFTYLQPMLLNDMAADQTSSDSLLIFMLMLMMKEIKNADMAPLLSAISSLLPSQNIGSPNQSPLPVQANKPAFVRSTSQAGNRSAQALNNVIRQFHVESAERYRPYRNGNTYCNIFVWDVTRALGCEIPHYLDKESGQPRYYPNVAGAYELNANGVCNWLSQQGAQHGWQEITAPQAQYFANAGFPVVGAWHNSNGGGGHVQMVCPSRGGVYDPVRGVTVAQAGKYNFNYAYSDATMSADKIAQARYYMHE